MLGREHPTEGVKGGGLERGEGRGGGEGGGIWLSCFSVLKALVAQDPEAQEAFSKFPQSWWESPSPCSLGLDMLSKVGEFRLLDGLGHWYFPEFYLLCLCLQTSSLYLYFEPSPG